MRPQKKGRTLYFRRSVAPFPTFQTRGSLLPFAQGPTDFVASSISDRRHTESKCEMFKKHVP